MLTKLNKLDTAEWWLVSLVIAVCVVPAYMFIWMFHIFFQVALVPLAYIILIAGVLTLVAKACIFIVITKRELKPKSKENTDGS